MANQMGTQRAWVRKTDREHGQKLHRASNDQKSYLLELKLSDQVLR